MAFYPFELSEAHLVYACLGGFVVIFSMFSSLAKEKLYIGEVVFATLFGIAVGPYGVNIFSPRDWGNPDDEVTNEITLEVTRVVLALGVFAIGVELPTSYMWINLRSLSLLIIPVMAWGWFVSAALIVALFPGVTYLSALVISACLTPTDPILAAAIVNGKYADKNVPGHIRRLLAAESAANDGLAYPFLFFALYMTIEPTLGVALRDFFTIAILYEVVCGVLIGSFLGYAFSKLMRLMEKLGFIGAESYAVQFVSLALFTIGIVTVLGCDDLLAAFAAGCAVSWDGHFNEKSEDTIVFATLVEVLLNCVVFVFIGSWIRFADWNVPDLHISPGRLAAFFFSVLFVRRIPPLLLLYKVIPDIHSWQQALFCGWFGPMGVGAVFISTFALTILPQPAIPPTNQQEILAGTIQPIVSFTILGSILIHGLSIPAFSMIKRINTITTVSRTWTNSGLGTPEWLNQVRRTDRAEDVRIDVETNRSMDVGVPTVDTVETAAEITSVEPGGEKKRVQTVAFDLPSGMPSRTPSSSMMTPTSGERSSNSPVLSLEAPLPHLPSSVLNSPTGSVVDVSTAVSDKKRSHPSVAFDLGSGTPSRTSSPVVPDVGSDKSPRGENHGDGGSKDQLSSDRRNANPSPLEINGTNEQPGGIGITQVHKEARESSLPPQ